jgi:hypothetical protein
MRGSWRSWRRWRVLASVAIVAGLIGVGEVPAGASRSGRADDVPQPADEADEVVPFVAELIDFGLLRDTLRERYPNTFAGLVNDGDDSVTIYETRATSALHQWVDQQFRDAASDNDVDPALIPTVTYRTAGRSLDSLFRLKDTIMGARGLLQGRGVGLETVGVQDGANKLLVGVNTPTTQAQAVLEQLFGRGSLRAIPWRLTTESDRYNDSSPWNGGDQLVTEGTNPGACTSGFGMHNNSTGAHYLTTAGHCGTHTWWNTWAGFPIRTNATLVGSTTGSVWNGTYFGYDVDTQKILTSSSSIIWTDPAVRRYMSAPLDVAQGDPTCIEGSFSGTECGTIYATDFGNGGSQYLVDLHGATTVFGDSGAPSWRTSPFGPLAQGTHVGSLSSGLRVELNIYGVMFFNGLELNTPWDP